MTRRSPRIYKVRWFLVYKLRIKNNLEYCRVCLARSSDLTWGHIKSRSDGGLFTSDNITILCDSCNQFQETDHWIWLTPLAAEPDFKSIVGGFSSGESKELNDFHLEKLKQSKAKKKYS